MQSEPRTAMFPAANEIASNLSASIPAGRLDMIEGASRRIGKLPERILVAAHQACDMGALDIAAQLLASLEAAIRRKGRASFDPAHRRLMESLIAVHHRLWHLRHADDGPALTRGT